MRILGLDPGKNTFAASVVSGGVSRYKIEYTGMVANTITDLTQGVKEQCNLFQKELRYLIRDFSIDYVYAERFMNRGMFKGASGEIISIMLGALMSGVRVEGIRLVTAAQWKNQFNRHYDLKSFYAETRLVAHRIDATCIGLYGMAQLEGEKPFVFLDKPGGINTFRRRLEDTDG